MAKKRPCLACFNLGASSPAYAWITVKFPRMKRTQPEQQYGPVARDKFNWPKAHGPLEEFTVEKEVGLCWKHCQCRSKGNPNGLLDRKAGGEWLKTLFGYIPVRDGHYVLVGGPENYQIVTGASGRIPIRF
ncbi:MAG: hypothetical protein ABSA33_06250 [Candidatus Micrarchaeaceae archaeon]